jgi:hypothetical protein
MKAGGASTILLPLVAGVATAGAGAGPALALSAAGAAGGVAQGLTAHAQGKAQAAQLQRQREVEELRGKERANEIREEMRRRIGAQRAAMAARGIDPDGQGVGSAVTRDTLRRGEKDMATNAMNTAVTRDTLNARADQSKAAGRASMLSGFVDAATTMGSAAMTQQKIGRVPMRGPAKPPKRRPG